MLDEPRDSGEGKQTELEQTQKWRGKTGLHKQHSCRASKHHLLRDDQQSNKPDKYPRKASMTGGWEWNTVSKSEGSSSKYSASELAILLPQKVLAMYKI